MDRRRSHVQLPSKLAEPSAVNTSMARRMLLSAAAAVLALCTVTSAVTVPVAWAVYLWCSSHTSHLLAIAAAFLAAEAAFAVVFYRKAKRFGLLPDRHVPDHPTFDAPAVFNRFIKEQRSMQKYIDIEVMLRKWFDGVELSDIYRENVAELLVYGFWFMTREEYEAQGLGRADDLVHQLEGAWGLCFRPGYNPGIKFMSHLWQPIRAHWRPLTLYLGIEGLHALKHVMMTAMGFRRHVVDGGAAYYTFNMFYDDNRASPASDKPQTPILFAHGVGIGILPYVHMLARMAASGHPIIAFEFNHLAMRWTDYVPHADEVVASMHAVLEAHNIPPVCAVGHSYGTFFCSRLLQLHPRNVQSICLIDPVTLVMFSGKLIENFVYKPSEITTWFVARDIHHATSVCRRFFWSTLNLFPDMLPEHCMVVVGAKDELVPVEEVLAMLEHGAPQCGVMYHPTHKHADFLKDTAYQEEVVGAILQMIANADAAAVKEGSRRQSPTPAGAARRQAGRRSSWGGGLPPLAPGAAPAPEAGRSGSSSRVSQRHARSDSASSWEEAAAAQAAQAEGIQKRLRPLPHRVARATSPESPVA